MRPILFPILAIAAATALPAAASPEHDALVFLDSQVLPKKAAICAARLSGYPGRFDPAYRAWTAARRDSLANGEAFLRADARKNNVPMEQDIQAVVDTVTKQWTAAPIATLRENCEAMLVDLAMPPD